MRFSCSSTDFPDSVIRLSTMRFSCSRTELPDSIMRLSTMRFSSRTFPPAAPAAACLLLLAGALAGFARPAAAQTWDARGFLTINGGQQAASPDFSDNIAFTDFAEEGDFDARYANGSDTLFDVGGGVRVWRNLGIGAGVSVFSHTGDAGITARIPHPFFFDRHRAIDGTEPGFAREETAVHLQALWVIPASRSIHITLSGGPTFFAVTQELVTGVNYDHAYPYDVATLSGTDKQGHSLSTTGFNVGGDVAFYFSEWIGVGGTVRLSRGSAVLTSPDGGTVTIDTGALQVSGGLRVRF